MPQSTHKLGLTEDEMYVLTKAHEIAVLHIGCPRLAPLSREQDSSIEKLCDVRNGLAHVIRMEATD